MALPITYCHLNGAALPALLFTALVTAPFAEPAETVWLDELDVSLSVCGWRKTLARKSVGGNRLGLGGKQFERGIGTHAPGRFCIELAGGSSRFTALVGLDDECKERGSVEFVVIGDGKLLWTSGIVYGDDGPQKVEAKLEGVKLLELIVTTAGDNYGWDHTDWVDAKFEVAGQRPKAVRRPVSPKIARYLTHDGSLAKSMASLKSLLGYHKQESVGETYLASMAEYRRLRPRYGPWHTIGPFDVQSKAFDGAEQIEAKDGSELQWAVVKHRIDGEGRYSLRRLPSLAGEPPLTAYLARTIVAPEAQRQIVRLWHDSELRTCAWLNGKRVGRRGNLRLALQKGENQLTTRVDYRRQGGHLRVGFRTEPEQSHVQRLFERIRHDFPDRSVEPLREYALLRRLLKDHGLRRRMDGYATQAFRRAALFMPSDRDPADVVVRRTVALLSRLKDMDGAPGLSSAAARLDELMKAGASTDVSNESDRFRLLEAARQVRRQIALSNPLLDFDRILFIKRYYLPPSERQGNHMCDQYFGFHAIRAGGLFVLENAFADQPIVRDVLAESVCENGRFKGRRLENGGFLSPELSFDGREILFAYTEAEPTRYKWSEKSTYHIFGVNVDGRGLRLLTDGPWNDFDPCYMPNGRILFVSERRGGYGRCHGRPVPTFTLHTMNRDGSEIVCISPHETNEWHPSIDHHGMIVYTRWDYVDRGHGQAHHPWIIAPDGRDARAIHGNFCPNRGARTNMEMDVRAIPGSHRYVATAAGHHAQAYGSLVLIDPHVKDDDSYAPIQRLTPEVLFTEAEISNTEGKAYATAWPLSEEFYLCVYDPDASTRRGMTNNHGIYLVDVFGNKELLYRDPEIGCLSPIPLRPRKKPPVIPGPALVKSPSPTAPVGVVDVYDGLKPFPEGTVIKALRIVQVLPKSTPYADNPRVGYGRQKNARAVLGTVPVEADGSAYFGLPAGKPVYFQALDKNGLAVQSMRSDTWVLPGQRLLCQGCHEPRPRAPKLSATLPLAFRRPASAIQPDVDGSDPFSFPRLVQPVLERNCLPCHAKHAKAPNLTKGNWQKTRERWYASYHSLRKHAFFFDGAGWTTPRTIPGQFGAGASRLYRMLKTGHHDLKLAKADLHRIALWLDSNSDFFGSYENLDAQARGEVVKPMIE